MLGWIGDIERETLDNGTFRTVVFTAEDTQLTVMGIEPRDDIGLYSPPEHRDGTVHRTKADAVADEHAES